MENALWMEVLTGKSLTNGQFTIAMFHYRRVYNPSQTWHFLACQNAMPFVSSVEAVIYGHSMYIFGGWDGHDTLQAGVILAPLSTGLRVDPKSWYDGHMATQTQTILMDLMWTTGQCATSCIWQKDLWARARKCTFTPEDTKLWV